MHPEKETLPRVAGWNGKRAGCVAALLALLLSIPAISGCELWALIFHKQFQAVDGLQVILDVKFLAVEDNFFNEIGVDFDLELDVEENGNGLNGASSSFDSAVHTETSRTGGVPNSHSVIPLGTSVDDLLPFVVDQNNLNYAFAMFMALPRMGFGTSFPFKEDGFTPAPELNGIPAAHTMALGTAPDLASIQASLLDDLQIEAVLKAVENNATSVLLTAPQVTLFNGQRAVLLQKNEPGFVQDFEVEIAQAAQAFDPQVSFLQTGVVLDVRPIVSFDRRFVRMELHPGTRGGVFPFSQQAQLDGQTVTLEMPVMQLSRVQTTVSVPDGGTILLGGIKRLAEGEVENGVPVFNQIPIINRLFSNQNVIKDSQTLYLMITPRIIIQEEEEAA